MQNETIQAEPLISTYLGDLARAIADNCELAAKMEEKFAAVLEVTDMKPGGPEEPLPSAPLLQTLQKMKALVQNTNGVLARMLENTVL